MSDPWTYIDESVSLGVAGSIVSLVEGSSFCLSDHAGDVFPGRPHGFFMVDSRFLSRFELRLRGRQLEPLSVAMDSPFSAKFIARSRPPRGAPDVTLLVFRHRELAGVWREEIVIRSYYDEPVTCTMELNVDADFAALFEVKEDRVLLRGDVAGEFEFGPDLSQSHFSYQTRRDGIPRGVIVNVPGARTADVHTAVYDVVVPARGEWSTVIEVVPILDGRAVMASHQHAPEFSYETAPRGRLEQWRVQIPTVSSDHGGLVAAVARSQEDLGALRMFDPEDPTRPVIAAGAPWFMTLFGRDSILTSWMALIDDPKLALGVLQTLARFQGERVDPETEEEPGKILHEMRFGSASSQTLSSGDIYFGSIDAGPLFVMLLGELRRWGLASEFVDGLMPHADRVLSWIKDYGDRDGDGYVEYQRATERGLLNQGWKDSWDAIRFADGQFACYPVALCEAQGYVYAAYLARAYFAEEANDQATADHYRNLAAQLKTNFNRDFWLDDAKAFALALDGNKKPVDAIASNMGHCLWTGIIDEDKAAYVAQHLMSPELFSGWGIRTLSSAMRAYNPISYHNGSVWPHDNAIIAAGLMRYGFVEEAQRVILALLDVASASNSRLPELFSGLDRADFSMPVGYPTSCSPQAWASASTLMFVRTLLRMDPWIPQSKFWLAPALPESISRLRVSRIPVHDRRVTVEIDDGELLVSGLGEDIELITEPRQPLTASLPDEPLDEASA